MTNVFETQALPPLLGQQFLSCVHFNRLTHSCSLDHQGKSATHPQCSYFSSPWAKHSLKRNERESGGYFRTCQHVATFWAERSLILGIIIWENAWCLYLAQFNTSCVPQHRWWCPGAHCCRRLCICGGCCRCCCRWRDRYHFMNYGCGC